MKTLRPLLLGGAIVFVASGVLPMTPVFNASDYSRQLPATLESDEVFLKRVELEFRCAGGPRPEALAELLAAGREHNLPSWGWALLKACEARAADCNDQLKYLSGWVERQDVKQHRSAGSIVESIRLEARLQAMSSSERRGLYLKVMKEGYVQLGPAWLGLLSIAIRALQEGMFDLAPAIQSGNAIWQDRAVERQLIITRAKQAKDPAGELQRLIPAGVDDETPRLIEGNTSLTQPMHIAVMALRELRRLNPPDGAQVLRGSLDRYETVKRRLEDRYGGQVRPDAYLGQVGWQIAEAVGDLGDRAAERQAFGGLTLWDQVHEVEGRLVKEHRLLQSAMIASDSR